MQRTLQMLYRPRLAAGLAALALSLVASGVALASLPYTVKVSVSPPNYIQTTTKFKVTASGVAKSSSQLLVYLTSSNKCQTTAVSEAYGTKRAINTRVSGKFSKTATLVAGAVGNHFACAYLTSPTSAKTQHAHGSASFSVVPGVY